MEEVIRISPAGFRQARRVAGILAALALILSACSGGGSSGTDPPAAPTIAPPATQPPDPMETPCLSLSPGFTARGTVSVLGGTDPDARQLSGLDWLLTPGCERVIFNFLTDEAAPASSIGLSRLEFFQEQGIVRITMPRDVTVTGIADALVEGDLVDRAYVVRSRSGDLSVDLYVNGDVAVEARGLLIGSPARLVVDIRPGPEDETFATVRPTVGTEVVLLSPATGVIDYPLRIRGYARTLDDVVTATVTGTVAIEAGSDERRISVVERRITAAPSRDAWGEYAVTISEGPAGELTLDVETERTGEPGGVSIALMTR